MMTWLLVAIAVVIILIVDNVFSLWRNIRTARAIGVPYVVVPYYTFNRSISLYFYIALFSLVKSFLKIPDSSVFRIVTSMQWPTRHHHLPFALLGSDTFLTAAPGGLLLSTADPEVIAQLTTRAQDFPKAAQLYKIVNIYGDNVVSSEGPLWRHHRKIVSQMFNESNHGMVWKETIDITQNTLKSWLRTSDSGSAICTTAKDCMNLSLAVIGRAGFGQHLEDDTGADKSILEGHSLTFMGSLKTVLSNIITIVMMPTWMLRLLPQDTFRVAWRGYFEWGRYMSEAVAAKKADISLDDKEAASKDLLSQLVAESNKEANAPGERRVGLTDSEIKGNLFVMSIAGHETSATAIHFTLIMLAMHPDAQRECQRDLAEIFRGRELRPDLWDYDTDLPRLMNSALARALNEELRLYPPTVHIPKQTAVGSAQRLRINGQDRLIPANTLIRIAVPSVHRNPNCWPPSDNSSREPEPKTKQDDSGHDLHMFRPSRWLNPDGTPYSPPKGAYIPFSDGLRSCLGRRFAQIEVLVALALILTHVDVELAPSPPNADEDAEPEPESDAESLPAATAAAAGNGDASAQNQGGSLQEGSAAWWAARRRAEWKMKYCTGAVITLMLRGGAYVPLRMVKRGTSRR